MVELRAQPLTNTYRNDGRQLERVRNHDVLYSSQKDNVRRVKFSTGQIRHTPFRK